MKVENNLIDVSFLYFWLVKNAWYTPYTKWGAIIAMEIVIFNLVPPKNLTMMLLAFSMGAGLGWALFSAYIFISLILNLLLNMLKNGTCTEYTLTLEERGILAERNDEQLGIWWDSVKRIEMTKKYIFLEYRQSKGRYIVIPKRLFPNHSEYVKYYTNLLERSGLSN